MLTELNQLGRLARNVNLSGSDAGTTNTTHVLCIKLSKDGTGYRYNDVDIEQYRPEDHLYRKKSSNGLGFLPSCMMGNPRQAKEVSIREQNEVILVKKLFDGKIVAWFDQDWSNTDIAEMGKAIKASQDEIKRKILEKYRKVLSYSKKVKIMLTLSFQVDDSTQYLSNFGNGKFALLLNAVKRDRRRKYESIGRSEGDGTCYLCNEPKNVTGFALASMGYAFAVPQKQGFSTNFSSTEMWKNIPVCDDCADNMEEALKYINAHLDFPRRNGTAGGGDGTRFRFWIIPGNPITFTPEIFNRFHNLMLRNREQTNDGLIVVEDPLLDIEKDEGMGQIYFNFLFYEMDRNKRHMDVRAFITDVLPSRFSRLNGIQNEVRSLPIFGEDSMQSVFGRYWKGTLVDALFHGKAYNNWPISLLYYYYSKVAKHGKKVIGDSFYTITEAIFNGSRLDIDIILVFNSRIREALRSVHKNPDRKKFWFDNFRKEVIRSLVLYRYLIASSAIKGENNMNENENAAMRSGPLGELDGLFEKLGVNDTERRAAVCVGILVNKVLCVQRCRRNIENKNRGTEPFWGKVNDLFIDREKLKLIARESIAKMRQYVTSFPDVEKEAFSYLAESENSSVLKKDEISYYFTVGLVLGDSIARKNVCQDISNGWC